MHDVNKKDIQTEKKIRLPFDGTAKCCDEVAKMIGEAISKRREEKIHILFPEQWAMSPANIFRSECGVLALLCKDSTINENYKFTCFANNGELGITATRSC